MGHHLASYSPIGVFVIATSLTKEMAYLLDVLKGAFLISLFDYCFPPFLS